MLNHTIVCYKLSTTSSREAIVRFLLQHLQLVVVLSTSSVPYETDSSIRASRVPVYVVPANIIRASVVRANGARKSALCNMNTSQTK
jgi:hypothetical protein